MFSICIFSREMICVFQHSYCKVFCLSNTEILINLVSNQMPVNVICYSVYETLSYLVHDLTEVKTECLIPV